jgi:hypothetical protein
MNSIIEWLIYFLTMLSVQPEQVPLAEARAAGAVCVAYSSLQKESIADEEELVHPPFVIDLIPEPEPEPPSVIAPKDCPDGNCTVPSTRVYRRWR